MGLISSSCQGLGRILVYLKEMLLPSWKSLVSLKKFGWKDNMVYLHLFVLSFDFFAPSGCTIIVVDYFRRRIPSNFIDRHYIFKRALTSLYHVFDLDVQQNFSETSAPVLTLKKRFTDSTISVTQTQNATQIAQNKSSIPHMYATVKCDVTLYNQYCETLSKEYERFTSVVLLSRILCKVIREQKLFDLSNSSLDVDVTCDGEEYTLIDCHNKTIDQLLVQVWFFSFLFQ